MKTGAFDIRDFGATGVAAPTQELELTNLDYKWFHYPPGLKATIYQPRPGAEYDSDGIQRAIDAAHAAGGGTVGIPAGDYLIAPLELKSRVDLHLEPGARLWGSPDLADYLVPDGVELPAGSLDRSHGRSSGNMNRKRRLISAHQAEDVSITGHGQISGQSPCWAIPWMNAGPTGWNTLHRPSDTMLFLDCQRVRLQDFRLKDTPCWSVVFDCCRHVTVQGIQIHAFDVINSDGIDLVNTSDVMISNCDLHVTDDGICLKNPNPDQTMRNVVVTNCIIRTLCNGLKIGTDTAGNFEDITFNNIVIHNPEEDWKGADGGINICAVDGGYVRNVNISNIIMRNVESAFYLVSSCRSSQAKTGRPPRAGTMERIFLSNIQADGTRFTSFAVGRPEQPIRDLSLTNISIRKTAEFCDRPPDVPVPECADQYPNPYMFGSPDGGRQGVGDGLPACGLYLRDVDRAVVRNFRVSCTQPDGRILVVEDRCRDLDFADIRKL